jgi:YD repeat-containing protein
MTPEAWQQVTVYDPMGRGNPWVVFDALGQPTTYTYNSHGQQTSVTDPAGGRRSTVMIAGGCWITRSIRPGT